MLRDHKVKQLELRLVLGLGNINPTTPRLQHHRGELLRPRNITKAWSRVAPPRSAAVPFHALRHTHASVLINAGVTFSPFAGVLGHGKASMRWTLTAI